LIDIKCPKENCGANDWVYSGYKIEKDGTKSQRFYCKACGREFRDVDILPQMPGVDIELLRENIRLAKQKVYFRDRNRIERKSFTEYARLDNATSDYSQELVKLLEKYNLAEFTIVHNHYSDTAVGIIHFTDAHFNELVSLAINKYDFSIAAKRCQLLVSEAKLYFKTKNIHKILFAITGDMLSSDRRLDELLAQATNRSKASFIAVRLIELMLLDLNEDFNITVASVTGNESRIGKDVGWSDIITSDNYDWTIFNILALLFRGSKGIEFITNADPQELVVKVNGKNILLIHGHQGKFKSNTEAGAQSIKGKYAARGIVIDFIIFGHLHSTYIGDGFARGSSLVGACEYSDRGLQCTSRASQNIHIIYRNDRIDSIKIDLQDVTGVVGYDIKKEIEAYSAKSSDEKKGVEYAEV